MPQTISLTLLQDLNKYIMPLIEKDVVIIWDGATKERFLSATHCHVCKKELNRLVEPVVKSTTRWSVVGNTEVRC